MTSFRDPNAKSDRTQRRGNGGRLGSPPAWAGRSGSCRLTGHPTCRRRRQRAESPDQAAQRHPEVSRHEVYGLPPRIGATSPGVRPDRSGNRKPADNVRSFARKPWRGALHRSENGPSIRASKGDVVNCCGKMPSPRRAGLPGSFNLSKQLRMSPLSNQRVTVFSERRESRYQM